MVTSGTLINKRKVMYWADIRSDLYYQCWNFVRIWYPTPVRDIFPIIYLILAKTIKQHMRTDICYDIIPRYISWISHETNSANRGAKQ